MVARELSNDDSAELFVTDGAIFECNNYEIWLRWTAGWQYLMSDEKQGERHTLVSYQEICISRYDG